MHPTGSQLSPPPPSTRRSPGATLTRSSRSHPPADELGVVLRRAIQDAVHAVAVRVCLTRRERSVFTRLAMGYGHAAIAAELGISARTVKMHATSLRNKTGTGSRSALLQVLFAA